jgi:hypothetical protein
MAWIKCEIPKEYCRARSGDGGCMLKITCAKIVEKCKGEDQDPSCSRIENNYCRAYINPGAKWGGSRECPLADHLIKETKKKRIRSGGQVKWGKRK